MPQNTLKKIADAAGVSAMTVLRVLRHDPRVSAGTADLVRRALRKLPYHPNPSASLLSRLRSGSDTTARENLAILVQWKTEEWKKSWALSKPVQGALKRAIEIGYSMEVFWVYEPGMNLKRLEKILQARQIRGVLVLPENYETFPSDFIELLQNRACVTLGGPLLNPPFHFASHDLFTNAAKAAKEILKLGYSRPGLALFRQLDEFVGLRYSGGIWSAFGTETRVPVCRLETKSLFESTSQTARDFAAWYLKYRPDVIITHNRRIPVNEWLHSSGVRVPQDVGWASLDLFPVDKGLAGIDTRSELVGAAALETLISLLHHNQFGIPLYQKGTIVEGIWRNGQTLKKRRATLKGSRKHLRK